MKSDDPETDKTVSIRQIQPLLARSIPRVIAPITDKKGEHERDNGGVAKATITHSESGKKDRKKLRRLVSELTLMEVKKSKDKGKRRKAIRVPSVDTSQARGSSDVVRLAIKELGWREVCAELDLISLLTTVPALHMKSKICNTYRVIEISIAASMLTVLFRVRSCV